MTKSSENIKSEFMISKSHFKIFLTFWKKWEKDFDWQQDLFVQDADYELSASYACQKSWTISLTKQ